MTTRINESMNVELYHQKKEVFKNFQFACLSPDLFPPHILLRQSCQCYEGREKGTNGRDQDFHQVALHVRGTCTAGKLPPTAMLNKMNYDWWECHKWTAEKLLIGSVIHLFELLLFVCIDASDRIESKKWLQGSGGPELSLIPQNWVGIYRRSVSTSNAILRKATKHLILETVNRNINISVPNSLAQQLIVRRAITSFKSLY